MGAGTKFPRVATVPLLDPNHPARTGRDWAICERSTPSQRHLSWERRIDSPANRSSRRGLPRLRGADLALEAAAARDSVLLPHYGLLVSGRPVIKIHNVILARRVVHTFLSDQRTRVLVERSHTSTSMPASRASLAASIASKYACSRLRYSPYARSE